MNVINSPAFDLSNFVQVRLQSLKQILYREQTSFSDFMTEGARQSEQTPLDSVEVTPVFSESLELDRTSTNAGTGRYRREICHSVPVVALGFVPNLFAGTGNVMLSSVISWIFFFIILYFIFQLIKCKLKIKKLLRIKTAISRIPIQCGICDKENNFLFYTDYSNSLEPTNQQTPQKITDLNIELQHELQEALPGVFETHLRKSTEFNSYTTRYKIDFVPLPTEDYGVQTVLWVVHDISDLTNAFSERMKIFQLLQNTLRSIDDAVISTNCDGEITLVNPSAIRMAGLKKTEMQNKLFDEIFHIRDENREPVVKRVIRTRQNYAFHSEVRIAGRQSLYVDGLITPIIEDQLILGTVLYFHDTTDLVQKEQKLQQALSYAQVSDRVKSDFLAAVCHEFRSSINVIIGYCDLNTEASSKTTGSNIEDIKDEAEKLLAMFNDILDVSKNNSNDDKITPEPINLNTFTRELQRIFSRTSDVTKVPLVVQVRPNVPVILTDYKILRQIFMRLLTLAFSLASNNPTATQKENSDEPLEENSKLASENQTGQETNDRKTPFFVKSSIIADTSSDITLPPPSTELEGDAVELIVQWIQNNLVFELSTPFSRMPSQEELDTAIFEEIFSRLGGSLDSGFSNDNDTADRYTWTLVLKNPEFGEKIQELPSLKENSVVSSRKKKDVIILVDDIAVNLKIVASMLKMNHIETVSCTTVHEAINEINQYTPIAIFMDLWMPDIGGEELAHILNKNPETANIPRVLMTADTQIDENVTKLFQQVIYKPLKPDKLRSVLAFINQNNLENV